MGTIIITGANSSLAIPAVQHLLTKYPDFTLVLTVRNASDADSNTGKLRAIIARFPNAKSTIRELDLASLAAVNDFAGSLALEIAAEKLPPLTSLVCNAYYWNLVHDMELTADGYEKSFQVTPIAHVALVCRLLGSFGPSGGRVVLFSSDAHMLGKNGLEKYPPVIPDDLDQLVHPSPDVKPDNFGRGFQRYAVSKLAVVMWMYALNDALERTGSLDEITAVAINPGNLSDSRALRVNTPTMLYYLSKFIIQPLRPLLRLLDPTMRTAREAGDDVAELAMNAAHPGARGYFTLLKPDESSPETRDKEKQRKLWVKSFEWARITPSDTAVKVALDTA